MDSSVSASSKILENIAQYKKGSYTDAIEKLKNLPEERKNIFYKNYYIGLSYLANKETRNAIPYLKNASNTFSPILKQKATWYLALAYLRNGDKTEAMQIFEKYGSDNKSIYHKQAKDVLKIIR